MTTRTPPPLSLPATERRPAAASGAATLTCCPLPPGCLRCAGTGWLDYFAGLAHIYFSCPACRNY